MAGLVVAVSRDDVHRFSKRTVDTIVLVAGIGVEGDAHAGVTVQHRSRVARDPSQPNLRQVHLIHRELLDEVDDAGFTVPPGAMGENITTSDIELLALPVGAQLRIGAEAVVELTGLRNPCLQIDGYEPGLLKRMVGRDPEGNVVRRAGVMSVVLHGGEVRPGDAIEVVLPAEPHLPLAPV